MNCIYMYICMNHNVPHMYTSVTAANIHDFIKQ